MLKNITEALEAVTPLLIPLSDLSRQDIARVGGKAAALGELIRLGVPVPPGFVIPAGSFNEPADPAYADALDAAFDSLGTSYVAVRSSAVAEDGAAASWAGQLQTTLGVTFVDLPSAIAECQSSANTQHARAYATVHNSAGAVAVIIQRMVEARCAGVMFTANPVTGNQSEIIIEAVAGLGELLVQGSATPESWHVTKATGDVTSHTPNFQDQVIQIVPMGLQTLPVHSSP